MAEPELRAAGRAGLRERLLARASPWALDRALADGADPETSPALALRARRLTAFSYRLALASSLERVLRDAAADPEPFRRRMSASRRNVAAAAPELAALARAIASPGPVSARGMARARLLISDGTGPLFDPASRQRLDVLAARAIQGLSLPASARSA